MPQTRGVQIALDLARMPSFFRSSAAMALPSDVTDVIRIAGGDKEACLAAEAVTGQSTLVLTEAARLYVKQVLFRPGADCFRVLGVLPGSPKSLARYHMRLLLTWLHPDHNSDGDSIFANRVLLAWSEYSRKSDDTPPSGSPKIVRRASRRTRRRGLSWVRIEGADRKVRPKRLWPYLMLGALGLCAVMAATFPDKLYTIAKAVPFRE